MEIKTCEHYVVNRIMELENIIESQKQLIKEQSMQIMDYEAKVEAITDLLSIKKSYDWSTENPSTYIDFKTIWKKHEPDAYEYLCETFGLVEPSEDEEEE